jgi:hypothetical protein
MASRGPDGPGHLSRAIVVLSIEAPLGRGSVGFEVGSEARGEEAEARRITERELRECPALLWRATVIPLPRAGLRAVPSEARRRRDREAAGRREAERPTLQIPRSTSGDDRLPFAAGIPAAGGDSHPTPLERGKK